MKKQHTTTASRNNTATTPPPYGFSAFCARLISALADLKRRLQAHYEQLHPDHSEVVREVVAEAEAAAWDLSAFPHLVLPGLVEVRMAELALEPAFARSEDAAFAYAA